MTEIVAVLTCLVNEELRALEGLRLKSKRYIAEALNECRAISTDLEKLQRRVDSPCGVVISYAPLAYQWANGCSWS